MGNGGGEAGGQTMGDLWDEGNRVASRTDAQHTGVSIKQLELDEWVRDTQGSLKTAGCYGP